MLAFQSQPVAVKIRVLVDEKGQVVSAAALPQQKTHAAYIQAAEAAAIRCRFKPAHRGSTAVGGEVILNFRFMPENQD